MTISRRLKSARESRNGTFMKFGAKLVPYQANNEFYSCITVATTLTPWELWLVRKTEDERRRIEKERQEKVGFVILIKVIEYCHW